VGLLDSAANVAGAPEECSVVEALWSRALSSCAWAADATPAAEAPLAPAARSIRASRRVRGATGRGVGAFDWFC
ncbi:MAG: hypothetical protein L0K10_00500, partial [Brevibacterium aurantiacum]|nr:hypothetical protein [Brevibacterium aurantiacum]